MSDDTTFTPSQWESLADDLDQQGPENNAWADWHRAMAKVQRAVNATLEDAADGMWPTEQVDALERRLNLALADLRRAARAGEEAMAP